MNVMAINGSPRGKAGNTAVMIEALLGGFRAGGDRVVSVELADRDIRQCRGCSSCWTRGACVQDDDMHGVLEEMHGVDFFIFGSPVYFSNVSGTLKTFFDRLTAAGGDPHAKPGAGAAPADPQGPRWIMVSNCGFPVSSQFDVVSLWIHNVAAMSRAELAGEFYAAGGRALSAPGADQAAARLRYLDFLWECGACYSSRGTLSRKLAEQMSNRQPFPAAGGASGAGRAAADGPAT
jgi:putative NADPH-quinone reductase